MPELNLTSSSVKIPRSVRASVVQDKKGLYLDFGFSQLYIDLFNRC